ncbi:unnamed protein product, partial [marine sediment metagenome]
FEYPYHNRFVQPILYAYIVDSLMNNLEKDLN